MTLGITADSLKGKHVIDSAGIHFGAIEGVAIDPATWSVRGLIVKVRRDVVDRLPMTKPLMGQPTLDVSTDRIANMTDNVLLNVSVGEIAGLLSERPE